MPEIRLGTQKINYVVKRSKRRKKTLTISVSPESGVCVSVPQRTSLAEVETLVIRKSKWILKQLEKNNSVLAKPAPRQFTSGEEFLYLGRTYILTVQEEKGAKSSVSIRQGKLLAKVRSGLASENRARRLFSAVKSWYMQQAINWLSERVAHFAPKVGMEPSQVSVRSFRARWGSCDQNQHLKFSWRIIMAPPHIVDYVVVHEMCHLRELNHSKRFWALVGAIVPDFRECREWLRLNGPALQL